MKMNGTIRQALQKAASFLRDSGIEAPGSEAECLLGFVLGRERTYLYSHGEEKLTGEQLESFQALTGRRAQKEPLAYITGEKEFMGKTFQVSPDVLIPRPETEHLVEAVLYWLRGTCPGTPAGKGISILDLGTGCGNIAVILALNLPGAAVTGVDVSEAAVKMARKNALLHGVEERVTAICSSFWDSFVPGLHRFQVIVSNPPYIPGQELSILMAEVQKEPRKALDGGPDGMKAYRDILPSAREYLVSPGLVAVEIGYGQVEDVLALGENAGLSVKDVIRDYGARERVILFEG